MATPASNVVALSGDARIDGLVQGSAWQFSGPRVITYSLNINDTPGQQPAWSAAFADAVAQAFQDWSNVANITFQRISSGGLYTESSADIAMTLTGSELQGAGVIALGIFPDPSLAERLGINRADYPRPEGDIFFDSNYQIFQYLYRGSPGYATILHEIGHALGLKHPDDDGLNARPTFGQLGLSSYDNTKYSVMSNNDTYGVHTVDHSSTPMVLDIRAIQAIYGANLSYHAGDDTYTLPARWYGGFNDTLREYLTIWDAGGTDTIDVSAVNASMRIDLAPGTGYVKLEWRDNRMNIADGVVIENVVGGTGADTIIGNDANNYIDGNGGGDGMAGGRGDDTYVVHSASDSVIEFAGQGTDTVMVDFTNGWFVRSYTLPFAVESGTVMGSDNGDLTGNELDNRLVGNSGINRLAGGLGNDTYVIQNSSDTVVEAANQGIDTLVTPFTTDLSGTNIENLTLTGAGNLTATGTAVNNVLTSNSGTDTLIGGAGDDTYVINSASHVLVENAGEGTDTVQSSVAYTLASNFENLVLTGWAPLDGTGNGVNNVVIGNGGSNRLNGAAGDDELNGAGGNDVLVDEAGSNAMDGGGGTDAAVFSSARSAYGVTYSNGLLVVTANATGATNTLSKVEYLRFADSTFLNKPVTNQVDFDGDGRSDILLRDITSGTVGRWTVNGTSFGTGSAITTASTDWSIAGTADFNGDGRGDILWRNDDGTVGVWLMSGGTLTAGVVTVAPSNWNIAGTGDFNGDGRGDILWHSESGTVGVWLMNGMGLQMAAAVTDAPANWRVVGAGDMDADGRSDILWQSDGGTVGWWKMNGTSLAQAAVIADIDASWRVVGSGDFNADHRADVLLRQDNGNVGIWLMNGGQIAGAAVVEQLLTSSTIVSVGDFDGDGRSDILSETTNGTVRADLVNGLNVVSTGMLAPGIAADWVFTS